MQNDFVAQDALTIICGKLIARGGSRVVYENRLNTNTVIKIEHCNGLPFQNINEWQTWLELKDTKAGKWLAPCHSISNRGHILIQERTYLLSYDNYPKKIPKFLTDTKYENFGQLNNRFVCHDYGQNRLFYYGCSLNYKKAEWYQAYNN